MDCPYCGTPGLKHHKTYVRKDGITSKRYRCKNPECLKGYTEQSGKRTGPPGNVNGGLVTALKLRKLNPDQVYRVLTDYKTSVRELAALYGVGRQVINGIRSGKSYRDVHEDLPRLGNNQSTVVFGHKADSCHPCIHWSDHCSMEFPEGRNGSYAPLCSCFMEREEQMVSIGISYSDSIIRMEELASA